MGIMLAGERPAERNGVFRWADGDAAVGERHADDAGWKFVFVDTSGVEDREGFLAVCREAFDLPAAVVRWEQLDGCLRSLDLEDEGLLVVWDGWASLADDDPDTFEMAVEVFQDACVSWRDDEVPGSVLLVGDGPETDLPAV